MACFIEAGTETCQADRGVASIKNPFERRGRGLSMRKPDVQVPDFSAMRER
jgi:hypothetical protein